MDKKYYIAANWKMNGSLAFINDYFSKFSPGSENPNEMIICPPDIYLDHLKNKAPDFIQIGAQNISSRDEGAFTGECSGQMLKDNAIKYAIIGHSERREYHHEKNDDIKLKLLKAINSNINPILCVGESIEQRESDQTFDVIDNQIRSVLDNDMLSTEVSILIAYEPIWAIGTGKTCEASEANRICGLIRSWVGSPDLIIQYGGSVKPANIDQLMGMSDIDGVLVGGASLDPEGFGRIANYIKS